MSKRRFFNKNQVTAGLSPCLQVDVQPTTPLAVRVPPSEFVSGDTMFFMHCVLAACANQEQQSTNNANQSDYFNEIRDKIVSLEEEGIFLKGMSNQDYGVIHIDLYNADQRAIRRVKEIISDEVDYVIWNEDDSILYVRGMIKAFSPKSNSQIYDRIFVEGLKEFLSR